MRKIGIDLMRYRPGRHGGGETFLESYLDGLARRDAGATIFAGPHNAEFLRGRHPAFRILEGPDALDPRRREAVRGDAMRLLEGAGCDFLHFPLSTIWPAPVSGRVLLTLFDVQHWDCPGNFTPEDLAFRDEIYRRSIGRAEVIHVPTEYTAERVAAHVPEARDKLVVWPLFLPPLPAGPAGGSHFHYPAVPWPHKNHALLFEAFAKARPRLPRDFRLVLTGRPEMGSVDLPALARRHGIEDGVRLEGFRTRAEALRWLGSAVALVFPSSYEGFGFPILEAMWLERPILAARGTSITEVAGDAAMLLPEDPDAWAEALVRVSGEGPLQRDLVERGRRRRVAFTEDAFFAAFQERMAA